jgi:hypothetical protein
MAGLHPVQQQIRAIDIDNIEGVQGGYLVGRNNVTRIEATSKPGLHCDIPYVRVWAGETCIAEFCQHNIVGVYFDPAPVEADQAPAREAHEGGWPADHTGKGDCLCVECIPF